MQVALDSPAWEALTYGRGAQHVYHPCLHFPPTTGGRVVGIGPPQHCGLHKLAASQEPPVQGVSEARLDATGQVRLGKQCILHRAASSCWLSNEHRVVSTAHAQQPASLTAPGVSKNALRLGRTPCAPCGEQAPAPEPRAAAIRSLPAAVQAGRSPQPRRCRTMHQCPTCPPAPCATT